MHNGDQYHAMKKQTTRRMVSLALVFATVFAMAASSLLGFKRAHPGRALVALSTLAALSLASDRTTYLPFLGAAVFPTSALKATTPPNVAASVVVRAPAGVTHVVYWAAEPGVSQTPWAAYGSFENAGVVEVLAGGATLYLPRCPGTYKVRRRGAIPRHVHYRFVSNGILGDVMTVPVDC